ncbi:MAG: hypothetical protein HOQ44_11130 [Nocardia sp.]|nr:hypothetical protein [Nocardia sp.]
MASEVERIGEECRRYSERMVERMAEAKARREARSTELAEQSAADMRRFWADMAEAAADQEGREHDSHTGVDEPGRQDTDRAARFERGPEPDSAGPRELGVPRPHGERHRQNTGSPAPGGGGAGVPGVGGEGNTTRPGPPGELDPSEVIARSIAARRRNSVVAPIDDDGDDEADYYRRNSWLV